MEDKTTIKCVLVGDIAVGKTSLRKKFVNETFSENYLATLGVDFATKTLNINDRICELQIWDIAGQPNYYTVADRFLKNSDAAILVYDVCNRDSFEHLNDRIKKIRELHDQEPVFIILGNKVDLKQPEMNPDQIDSYFREQGYTYDEPIQTLYSSAKTGENVENAFRVLAKKALSKL